MSARHVWLVLYSRGGSLQLEARSSLVEHVASCPRLILLSIRCSGMRRAVNLQLADSYVIVRVFVRCLAPHL